MKVTKDDKVKIGCLAIIFIVMVFVFTQCMRSGKDETKTPAATEKVSTSQSEKEKQALEIIKENFDDNCKIEFNPEHKAYMLTPNYDDFSKDIISLINSPDDPQLRENWNNLVASFEYASKNLISVVGNGYSIVLVNPENSENQLLTASDGKIIYNFIDEQ
ncbi:MAG: hypothetical protein KHZ82_02600 [Peptoniphilus harei]|nr:hypothetical protein [Peptoniphilus harei]